MEEFLRYWFGGFDQALQQFDDDAVILLLKECGAACSRSYTEKIFKDAHQAAQTLDDFFICLKAKFPELQIVRHDENTFSLIYCFCACDLVTNHYVTSPKLCQCSRMSLQYNFDALFGEGHVEITMRSSILGGDAQCEFLVTLS